MSTKEIADRLVELCRTGQNMKAYDELFADHAVAIEPPHAQAPDAKGLDALREKTKGFQAGVEKMHDAYISEPLVAGNHFTLTMGMDVSMKDGNRMKMEEVCVYEVKDGKIIKEQFFF